jgi:hypothetical protein
MEQEEYRAILEAEAHFENSLLAVRNLDLDNTDSIAKALSALNRDFLTMCGYLAKLEIENSEIYSSTIETIKKNIEAYLDLDKIVNGFELLLPIQNSSTTQNPVLEPIYIPPQIDIDEEGISAVKNFIDMLEALVDDVFSEGVNLREFHKLSIKAISYLKHKSGIVNLQILSSRDQVVFATDKRRSSQAALEKLELYNNYNTLVVQNDEIIEHINRIKLNLELWLITRPTDSFDLNNSAMALLTLALDKVEKYLTSKKSRHNYLINENLDGRCSFLSGSL